MRDRTALRERIDGLTAKPMFAVSLLFLVFLSGTLHLHEVEGLAAVIDLCLWGMIALWPLFAAEAAVHGILRSPGWRRHLLYSALPPLRLCARDHVEGTRIWLPVAGWSRVDEKLRDRIEQGAALPMIVIALMVLPLLAIESYWTEQIAANPRLGFCVHAGTGLIWVAFTFEFIVMISIVEKKLRYCREHWIDLIVILLPLVAFLRVARVGRLLRLQQLSRTARAYRLRGLLMRAWRAVLLLDVIDRLIRGGPEKRLERLRETLAVKEAELEAIRAEVRELEAATAQTDVAAIESKAA